MTIRPQSSVDRSESSMVLVTSLVLAFIATDRMATGYIGPFLLRGLNLSNTQLGAVFSAQAVSVAIAGYLIGRASDRAGRQKACLVPLLLLSSLLAAAALLAKSYTLLLALRFALGAAMGAVTPITQAVVTRQSTPSRVGRNIGIQTLILFLVSQMLGPIVLTRIADVWGWRASYAFLAGPFAALAIILLLALREPFQTSDERHTAAEPISLKPFQRRTIALCMLISGGFMMWAYIHATFMPIYLVQHFGYTPTSAGTLMGALGLSGCLGGFGLPLLSDRLGRRSALLIGMGFAVLVPLVLLTWVGPSWGLQVLLFVGWAAVGSLPIYAVILPSEMVPANRTASTVALIVAVGEILGGVASPILGGWLADRFGLAAPFWFTLGSASLCFVAAALLPRRAPSS